MIFFAKSSKSTVSVKLSATTLTAAKREAWSNILEQYTSVSLFVADEKGEDKLLVAYKEVDSMTGRVRKWVDFA